MAGEVKELVIVPTFKREELLYLCLEAIRSEDGNIPVFVFSDRGEDSTELREACAWFHATCTAVEKHSHYGNSWNVIEACRLMLKVFPELEIVHVIEDDTILHGGYLEWARSKLATGMYQAVCGHIGNDLDTWYTSPCSSWSASHLRSCLAMVPVGYFADTIEGMQKVISDCPHFFQSRYRYGSAEQDGFFLRCIEKFGWHTVFPTSPLCQHLGAWGYNRPTGERPTGEFTERIAWCRKLLTDTRRRYELFGQRITDLELSGAK